MADVTFRNRIFRFAPNLYSAGRSIYRAIKSLTVEIARSWSPFLRIGAAKGSFRAIEAVQSGQLMGRVVVTGQDLPTLGELSLIDVAGMNQNGRQPWPFFWSKHQSIHLVGRSLVAMNTEKNLLLESAYGDECVKTDPAWNYLYLPKPVVLKGKWTSLISRWSEGYYHWFLDTLPRLALIGELPEKTRILVKCGQQDFYRESLMRLGLLDRIRETREKHLFVEDYYFSSLAGMTGCTNPFVVHWLRKSFLGLAENSRQEGLPKRFYIKRKGKTRGILNDAEVISFFEGCGWEIVDTEGMSFATQIALFSQAEAICGPHGAAFTNLLWCKPGCKVLELCSSNYLNGCYEAISLCLGIEHNFLIFPGNMDSCIHVNIDCLRGAISAA